VAGSLNLVLVFFAFQLAFFSLFFLTTFKNDRKGIDASWKYLFSGLIFSLFYLFGVALILIAGGGFELDKFSSVSSGGSLLFWTGFFLILLSLLYKLALFPFHNWAADVYEGTAAPLAAYLATAEKLPVFILLIRLLNSVSSFRPTGIQLMLWLFAASTVIFINILALRENNLRGMLSYSSIAQCGYPLLGLLVGGPDAHIAIIYFLIVYILMNINVYGIIMFAAENPNGSCYYPDLAGFSEKHHLLATCLGIGLVALVGLPPTAGLFGRVFLYSQAFRGGYPVLVLIAAAGTLLSAAYYFKVIRYAFFEPCPEGFSTPNKLTPLAGAAAFLTAVFILLSGILPAILYRPLRFLIKFL
jgi:NADH-quinone oxidoreductase subunit N